MQEGKMIRKERLTAWEKRGEGLSRERGMEGQREGTVEQDLTREEVKQFITYTIDAGYEFFYIYNIFPVGKVTLSNLVTPYGETGLENY